MSIEQIIDDFRVLDDWDDRYRYIIDLGRRMPPLPDELKREATKVRGCASQVWLEATREVGKDGRDVIRFRGDSDALIVRGLIALLLELYSGRTAEDILAVDARRLLAELGLDKHLSQQRSNGLFAMVERIRSEARAVAKTNGV
jgi:cysteine desulfuration protein SufE